MTKYFSFREVFFNLYSEEYIHRYIDVYSYFDYDFFIIIEILHKQDYVYICLSVFFSIYHPIISVVFCIIIIQIIYSIMIDNVFQGKSFIKISLI